MNARHLKTSHGTTILSVALTASMAATSLGQSPPATDEPDLQAQIESLAARVAAQDLEIEALRQARGAGWLTEKRAEEIQGLVHDVLADADTRASLLQGGPIAGHDGKNFYMASADGNFRMNITGFIQFRYVFNYLDDSDDPDFDSTRHGFENRRTKLVLSGHVIDPTWQYKIQGSFENSDAGLFTLEDAWAQKNFGNGWTVRVGQFKLPFMREDLMPAWKQLAVERSLVFSEFKGGRSQAVQVGYAAEQWKAEVAISDGFNALNMPALTEDLEGLALTGRVEGLLAGTWAQFGDFTSWRGEEFGLLLGAAAHVQKDEFGTLSGPEEETFTWTADASAEFGGANLFGAIVGRHLEIADMNQLGVVIQGGIFLTDNCEIFARYEWSDIDTAGVEDLQVVTIGCNKYLKKHNLKWSTDVGIGLSEIAPVFASSGAGWRADAAGADMQIVVRSQFQLVY